MYFPSDFHLSHFLVDCPLPEVSVCYFIDMVCFLYGVWQLDTKLVGSAPVAGLDLGDDVVMTMQYLGSSPLEGRFFNKMILQLHTQPVQWDWIP